MMSATVRTILISGYKGRLGSKAYGMFKTNPKFRAMGHKKGSDLSQCIAQTEPDLILDLTSADSIHDHLKVYRKYQIPTIIGTSGLTEQAISLLKPLVKFPLLIVPNFSQGLAPLLKCAEILSFEHPITLIRETHHEKKVDQPSSTALFIKNQLRTQAPIESIRTKKYTAKHEIIFGDSTQSITLSHELQSVDEFLPGILNACEHIRAVEGISVIISPHSFRKIGIDKD